MTSHTQRVWQSFLALLHLIQRYRISCHDEVNMNKVPFKAILVAIIVVYFIISVDRLEATFVWAVGNTVKIGRAHLIEGSNYIWSSKKKLIKIKSARNEYESFQIVITANSGDLHGLDIGVSDLFGPDTISRKNIMFYREAYYDATMPPGYAGSGLSISGIYPDALIPFIDPYDSTHNVGAPFDVKSGENQPIWVNVYVPPGILPGKYTGNIVITDNLGIIDTLTLQLTVWNFDLPNAIHIGAEYPLDGWWLLSGQYNTGDDTAALYHIWDRYYDFLANYHMSPSTFYLEPKCINSPDSVYLDFSTCDSLYSYLLDNKQLNIFDTPDVYRDNEWPPYCISDRRGNRYQKAQFNDSVFVTKVRQFYRQLYNHYVEKGWIDKHIVFVYDETNWVSDEPYNNPPEGYDRARAWANLVHEASSNLKFCVADNPIPYSTTWGTLIGYADMWYSYIDDIDFYPELFKERQNAGEEVGLVINEYCDFIDYKAFYHRSIGWFAYKYDLVSLGEWEVSYWVDENDESLNPWLETPTPTWGHGAGALLWPGKDIEGEPAKSIDGPVSSLRMELNRESIEDYEYLYLLEQKMNEDYVKGLVQKVLPTSLKDVATNPDVFYRTRDLIGNILGGVAVTTTFIEGTVTDMNSASIPDAEVSDGTASCITDDSGGYRLQVSPGGHTINASHPDYISRTKLVEVLTDTTMDFELAPIPKASYIFNSFETLDDLAEWEWEGVQLNSSTQHVTDGNRSLEAVFSDATDPYLGTWNFTTGWSTHHTLELDVYNNCDFYTMFGVAFVDKMGNYYGYEDYEMFYLIPNSSTHICIPLHKVKEKVDIANLDWLELFAYTREELEGGGYTPMGTRALYLDNMRLVSIVGRDSIPPAAPQDLSAVQDDEVINLTWDAPDTDADGGSLTGLIGYNVYRTSISGQSYIKINNLEIVQPCFTDFEVISDSTYYYMVTALDDGESPNESPYSNEVSITLVGVSAIHKKPHSLTLYQNYPNPFNLVTKLRYALPEESQVKLEIYNISGQKVTTLVNEKQKAGYHTIHWNGQDHSSKKVASGIYFYKLQARDYAETRKMALVR